uniref:Uncharacterized protein n=1 Tax=Cacopsylla melanoneura TaxID=428564 RepID=A0A8D8Z152_9HEMI
MVYLFLTLLVMSCVYSMKTHQCQEEYLQWSGKAIESESVQTKENHMQRLRRDTKEAYNSSWNNIREHQKQEQKSKKKFYKQTKQGTVNEFEKSTENVKKSQGRQDNIDRSPTEAAKKEENVQQKIHPEFGFKQNETVKALDEFKQNLEEEDVPDSIISTFFSSYGLGNINLQRPGGTMGRFRFRTTTSIKPT